MPLLGTLDVGSMAGQVARMDRLDTKAMTLEGARVLQLMWELGGGGLQALLPPALHPTIPPTVTLLAYSVDDSEIGPFTAATVRVGCRAGARPRAFTRACIVDRPEAAAALSQRWGYPCRQGDVALRVNHDRANLTACVDGKLVLDVALSDPEPVSGFDVHYVASLHLAHTPEGLQLVQVDPEYVFHRCDRGRPQVALFDGEALGDPRLVPTWPVSATMAVADLTLPALRYLSDPLVPAVEGTRSITHDTSSSSAPRG